MNAHATDEIRELTATETNEVSGGELMETVKKVGRLGLRCLEFLWDNRPGKSTATPEVQVIDISRSSRESCGDGPIIRSFRL